MTGVCLNYNDMAKINFNRLTVVRRINALFPLVYIAVEWTVSSSYLSQ